MNVQLELELEQAVRSAFSDLFQNYAEDYYYCTLVSQECACPYISAWSKEALQRYAVKNNVTQKDELKDVKWSYADSPYYAYGFSYFEKVNELFDAESCQAENFALWFLDFLTVMERVMHRLDEEGLFGTDTVREAVLLNAEVMPPDHGNTLRALRLNNKLNISEWLKDAAE